MNKIKILFVASNPSDTRYRFFLDNQIREIAQLIRLGVYREGFELVSDWSVSAAEMQAVLLRHRPDIVHFSGHGTNARGIALEDERGDMKLVSKPGLASLLHLLKDKIRLVVLQGPYSKGQVEAFQETIDFTVRMSATTGNMAGVLFLSTFYQALFFGKSIEDSFRSATNQLELEGLKQSETPKLLVRKGADSSKGFLVSRHEPASSHKTSGVKTKRRARSSKKRRLLQVFLCHSHSDKSAVRDLYRRLCADGIDPWLDEERIIPGQDWQREIPRAVRNSDAVLVCLSSGAIKKSGFLQKEITFALDVAEEQPEGTIYLIPVKLEECELPERLQRWQWVNLFDERGYSRLMVALLMRAEGLDVAVRPSPSL